MPLLLCDGNVAMIQCVCGINKHLLLYDPNVALIQRVCGMAKHFQVVNSCIDFCTAVAGTARSGTRSGVRSSTPEWHETAEGQRSCMNEMGLHLKAQGSEWHWTLSIWPVADLTSLCNISSLLWLQGENNLLPNTPFSCFLKIKKCVESVKTDNPRTTLLASITWYST